MPSLCCSLNLAFSQQVLTTHNPGHVEPSRQNRPMHGAEESQKCRWNSFLAARPHLDCTKREASNVLSAHVRATSAKCRRNVNFNILTFRFDDSKTHRVMIKIPRARNLYRPGAAVSPLFLAGRDPNSAASGLSSTRRLPQCTSRSASGSLTLRTSGTRRQCQLFLSTKYSILYVRGHDT